jgi:TolB protein
MQLILTFIVALLTSAAGPTPETDLLGDIVVEATDPGRGGPRLMRIVVPRVDGTGPQAALVDEMLRRDLDLSGQFTLLDASQPKSERSAEAIVRVSVRNPGGGMVELRAAVYFDRDADVPAYETSVTGRISGLRATCHRLVDDIIGTLTGYQGPFVSRLTFVLTRRGTRSLYAIDPDGFGLERISDERQLVSAAAVGPDDVVYYSASINNGRYRLYRAGESEPLTVQPPGSIYGIAFSPDRGRVALTIAMGRDVRLYAGASNFTDLRPVGKVPLTLNPSIAARGTIAVSGATGARPRIWVDGRAVSPGHAAGSSPDFCEHPDGTRLVYALGTRQQSHIVVADRLGRKPQQITRDRGRHSHPACSPDGRLIAFFSDRRSMEGPGLYVMRIDGYRPRKIANVRGDSLQWTRTSSPDQTTDSSGRAGTARP